MTMYIVSIFLILVTRVMVVIIAPNKNREKEIYIYIVSIFLALISGLRHPSIGADTLSYNFTFNQLLYTRWSDLINSFKMLPDLEYMGMELGFSFFVKTIQLITSNYQVFLVIVGFLFSLCVGKFILKNSKMPVTSFLIYLTMFFQFYGTTGIRQTIASLFAILVGYEYIKKKDLKKFILIVLLAITIHKSAMFFMPFYFIANKKITRNYIFMALGIAGLTYIFRRPLIKVIVNIIGYEQYAQQYKAAGTPVFTLMLLLLVVATLILYRNITKKDSNSVHYINAILVALILTPFTYIDPSLMRVVMYYSFFIILLMPEIIHGFRAKKDQILIWVISMTILITLFLLTKPQYRFFWDI